jgi:hypothetical protein
VRSGRLPAGPGRTQSTKSQRCNSLAWHGTVPRRRKPAVWAHPAPVSERTIRGIWTLTVAQHRTPRVTAVRTAAPVASPDPVQMWQRRDQSRCSCGSNAPGPGADVGGASPIPVQVWQRRAQSRRASVRADRVVRVWVLWIGYAYAARCLPRAYRHHDKGLFRPLHATCLRGRDRRGALGAWEICCVAPRHDPCALTADAPRRAPEWPTEGFHIYRYTYIHIYIIVRVCAPKSSWAVSCHSMPTEA